MTLIPIKDEHRRLARGYLKFHQIEADDKLVDVLARFAQLMAHDMTTLKGLVREKYEPKIPPATMSAREQFNSGKCPACGENKRAGLDWFGLACWRKLTPEMRAVLRFKWREKDLPTYFRALNYLKGANG